MRQLLMRAASCADVVHVCHALVRRRVAEVPCAAATCRKIF